MEACERLLYLAMTNVSIQSAKIRNNEKPNHIHVFATCCIADHSLSIHILNAAFQGKSNHDNCASCQNNQQRLATTNLKIAICESKPIAAIPDHDWRKQHHQYKAAETSILYTA